MKKFEVGVWRTEYGCYVIQARDHTEAERRAQQLLDDGEPFDTVRDADVGVGYVDLLLDTTDAAERFMEKFDVPQ